MKNKISKIIIPIIAIVILLLTFCNKQQTSQQPAQPQTEQQTVQTQAPQTQQPTEAAKPKPTEAVKPTQAAPTTTAPTVTEDGYYSSKDEVAAYIHQFGHLPDNYISKTKAKNLGWIQTEGNLWDILPGMSIGGGPFNNYDGQLPEEFGREYRECDIDYDGGPRNAKRIIYSNDGLIYYTGDHYETFERLY